MRLRIRCLARGSVSVADAMAGVVDNAAAAAAASDGDGHRGEEHRHGKSRRHEEDDVSRWSPCPRG